MFIKLTTASILAGATTGWAATPDLSDQTVKWTQIELNNLSFPKGDAASIDLEGRLTTLVIKKKSSDDVASERVAGVLLETPTWNTGSQKSYKLKMDDGSIRTIEFSEYQIIELWSALEAT